MTNGLCGDSGPDAAHCTETVGHRYSCYDASEDVSWNDGQWLDGWFDESPHQCDLPGCEGREPTPIPVAVSFTEKPGEPE